VTSQISPELNTQRKLNLRNQIFEAIILKDQEKTSLLKLKFVHRYGLQDLNQIQTNYLQSIVSENHGKEIRDDQLVSKNSLDSGEESLLDHSEKFQVEKEVHDSQIENIDDKYKNVLQNINPIPDHSVGALDNNELKIVVTPPPPPSLNKLRRWLPSADVEDYKAS